MSANREVGQSFLRPYLFQQFIDSGAERTQGILLAIILDPLNETICSDAVRVVSLSRLPPIKTGDITRQPAFVPAADFRVLSLT